ncbi:hypothetical protein ENBRE01_1497, partial [Enteropsectra breve]
FHFLNLMALEKFYEHAIIAIPVEIISAVGVGFLFIPYVVGEIGMPITMCLLVFATLMNLAISIFIHSRKKNTFSEQWGIEMKNLKKPEASTVVIVEATNIVDKVDNDASAEDVEAGNADKKEEPEKECLNSAGFKNNRILRRDDLTEEESEIFLKNQNEVKPPSTNDTSLKGKFQNAVIKGSARIFTIAHTIQIFLYSQLYLSLGIIFLYSFFYTNGSSPAKEKGISSILHNFVNAIVWGSLILLILINHFYWRLRKYISIALLAFVPVFFYIMVHFSSYRVETLSEQSILPKLVTLDFGTLTGYISQCIFIAAIPHKMNYSGALSTSRKFFLNIVPKIVVLAIYFAIAVYSQSIVENGHSIVSFIKESYEKEKTRGAGFLLPFLLLFISYVYFALTFIFYRLGVRRVFDISSVARRYVPYLIFVFGLAFFLVELFLGKATISTFLLLIAMCLPLLKNIVYVLNLLSAPPKKVMLLPTLLLVFILLFNGVLLYGDTGKFLGFVLKPIVKAVCKFKSVKVC